MVDVYKALYTAVKTQRNAEREWSQVLFDGFIELAGLFEGCDPSTRMKVSEIIERVAARLDR